MAGVLSAAQPAQLVRCELGNGGGTLWMEVVRCRRGRLEVICSGELLQISQDGAGAVVASPAGFFPRLGEPWVKATPGLADALKKVRQQQRDEGSLPSSLIAAHGIQQLQLQETLAEFQAAVAAAPGAWCDGAAPGDPPPSERDAALLTAGELAAFLAGLRGVCLLQLHKGWGDRSAALQALLRPWVLALLRAAAGHKGAVLLRSCAPQELGASLVLCARQQPFHAWGKHLASQGVQAAIVADSPFYKLLIGTSVGACCCWLGPGGACVAWVLPSQGVCMQACLCPEVRTLLPAGRILGYREANILHHIESTGGRLTGEVVEAVDGELAGLSSVPPSLPWASAGRKR